MYKYDGFDSRATFIGGRNGMVVGAMLGSLVFSVISFVLDMMNVGAGGPGLAVMAGLVVGGLAGTLIGALKARPGGRRSYGGAERRFNRDAFPGFERRTSSWRTTPG